MSIILGSLTFQVTVVVALFALIASLLQAAIEGKKNTAFLVQDVKDRQGARKERELKEKVELIGKVVRLLSRAHVVVWPVLGDTTLSMLQTEGPNMNLMFLPGVDKPLVVQSCAFRKYRTGLEEEACAWDGHIECLTDLGKDEVGTLLQYVHEHRAKQ